jgi:outer membrane protein TolC
MKIRFTCIFLAVLNAFGQFGPPGGQAQPTRANQLPLSGRSSPAGSVAIADPPLPGTTASIITLNPNVQVQGAYAGSVPASASLSSKLSFRDAIQRALEYNLGAISTSHGVAQARGANRIARSALLPNLSGSLSETVQQTNLEAFGLRFHFPIPGVSIPTVVGPFNYFDLRAALSQSVVDLTAWNNHLSAKENLRATEFSARDARDLVVLAAGGAYLQVIAAAARVQSARAQVETANALFEQASQQHSVGLVAQIDVNRSRVQLLTQQQRLLSVQNDLAKQKINLARIVGLPPNDRYELADDIPYAPASDINVENVIQQAFSQRSDLRAAEAQVRSAERARSAARAERLPSVSLTADYGAIGTTPDHSHGTFAVVGSLKFPIWQGGRVEGDVQQAEAALAQRQAERGDLRGEIEADVRKSYLDLQAATREVEVSRENMKVSQQNLKLTRQRFDAGVADNLEVVQSQESIANAEMDYINSVFAHNVAKLSLARASGQAAGHLEQFLKMEP